MGDLHPFRIGHHPDQHSSRPVPQGRRRSGFRHLPAVRGELRHALPVDHGGADHPVRLFRMQPVRRHQVRGPGREAGILPVFMDSHDLLFRGGRGGHVLVDHRAPVGHRAATAIRSAHEHAGL